MGKKDRMNRQPESNDALDAVEAVIEASKRRKNFFEANIIPLKGDSKRETRRKLLFDMFLLVMVACSVVLLWWMVIDPASHRALTGSFEGDATEVVIEQTEPPGPTQPGETTAKPEPTTKKPSVPKVRKTHEELLAMNKDYKCWLTAPGADIRLPIVKTANNDYYLYRNFDKKPSRYGNPFFDYRCDLDPPSTNLIVYGHHMRDGTIFSRLGNYRQAGVVRENPIITLEWADGSKSEYLIFSVLVINGRPKDDNGYVFAVNTPDFPSQKSFDGYIKQLKQRTYVNTGVDVKYGDKLLSLQTCVYDFDYEFLYIIGRQVRPGETAKVDKSQIKSNPNPRLPQAMYDKYKKSNPYSNAEQWQVPG